MRLFLSIIGVMLCVLRSHAESVSFCSQNIVIGGVSVIPGANYSVVYVQHGEIVRRVALRNGVKGHSINFTYFVEGTTFCMGNQDLPKNDTGRIVLSKSPKQYSVAGIKAGYTFVLCTDNLVSNFFATSREFKWVDEGIAIHMDFDYARLIASEISGLSAYYKNDDRPSRDITDVRFDPAGFAAPISVEHRELKSLFNEVAQRYHGEGYKGSTVIVEHYSNASEALDVLCEKMQAFASAHHDLKRRLSKESIQERVFLIIEHIVAYRGQFGL